MDFESYIAPMLKGIEDSGFPVKYSDPIVREEMLPMRDGVKLATDLFIPDSEGHFPTIVQRGCYAAQDPMNKILGKEFAKRGFAYVFQFCRGIGRSEGEWVPKVNERRDGKDLVDWLQEQDWVANMGYFGSSYLAMTGWAIADIVPSKMKTMYLSNYGVHDYLANYHNGILKPDITTSWAMDNAGWQVSADYLTSAKYRPAMTADVDLWGGELPWYRDVLSSTTEDSHYWSAKTSKNLRAVASKITIPLFMSEGWYDHHLENALATYNELSPETQAHTVLQIGGWNHFGQPAIFDRLTPNMMKNELQNMLTWFGNVLVDHQMPEGKIETYEINADQWHTQKTWSKGDQTISYFLSGQQPASAALVSSTDAIIVGTIDYDFDPENPVPSVGGEVMLKTMNQIGSRTQPEPNYRSDVISFVSEPLTGSQHLFGEIQLSLNVETDVDDTAFVAKVMEVQPDGRTFNIRTTITTVLSQDSAYQAGKTTLLKLTMLPIDWQLATGSCVRVDITSSDFPQYQIHSNFAGNQAAQKEVRTAHQRLHLTCDLPSTLTLPVIHD